MKQQKLLLVIFFCSIFGLSAFAQHENLYIIGGPFNSNRGNNWLHRDIVTLEKDTENADVFYYRGYIGYNTFGDEPGNFKILTQNNAWEGYHPVGDNNQMIGATQVGIPLGIREGGADTKWEVPSDRSGDGYYVIKVDTKELAFLIESFIPASCADIPVGLFMIGGPFIIEDLNWGGVTDVVKMERDDTDPYVFHYRGYMERNQWGIDPGNFKILINKRDWERELRPGGEEDVNFTSFEIGKAVTIRNKADGGPDKKWVLPEDDSGNGYWEFSIDARNLTLTINEFIHDFDYFEQVYIAGNAMPGGWTESNPEVMSKVSRGVYSWTGIVSAGEFKFLRQKSYSGGCYVAITENESVVLDKATDITYEKDYRKSGFDYKFLIGEGLAGKDVVITLDLNTKKMTVVDASLTAVEKTKNLSADIYAAKGKVFINGMENENYTVKIFNIAGGQIMQKDFVGNDEIVLPQGYYLISLDTESGNTIKEKIMVY